MYFIQLYHSCSSTPKNTYYGPDVFPNLGDTKPNMKNFITSLICLIYWLPPPVEYTCREEKERVVCGNLRTHHHCLAQEGTRTNTDWMCMRWLLSYQFSLHKRRTRKWLCNVENGVSEIKQRRPHCGNTEPQRPRLCTEWVCQGQRGKVSQQKKLWCSCWPNG